MLYLYTVPMSASCASLTGRPSTSRALPLYGEAPQTHCICSVWPRQSVQFSTICWACTYAPQKGHRQLCLTRKNSNDTVRNHHDCCHHQHHLMRPDPLNACAKPGMEMASGQSVIRLSVLTRVVLAPCCRYPQCGVVLTNALLVSAYIIANCNCCIDYHHHRNLKSQTYIRGEMFATLICSQVVQLCV
ncbi:hypothetical protein DPX16_20472 [Anabarilius grahami]|uniref:Uncharacterized protein n=1 Tax=Anabarilius grahami TaxID=495550 RepID=A0A3N0Z516_ANAGA|nr:hypothetical protein DPX16_20472 [Anabarilius grahami]